MEKLLAGPILRRTDARRVCIWFATSERCHMEVKVYTANLGEVGGSSVDNNKRSSIRVGERLFVHLIEALPSGDTFPLDELLLYDVLIDGENLEELGLVNGEKPLNYEGLPLPSFHIPSRLSNIIFGSCRKPHAHEFKHEGSTDKLILGDDLINGDPGDLKKRPEVLLLLGDQIYADDVAAPLLAVLKELAVDITGWRESLSENSEIIPANIKLNGRGELIRGKKIRFSSKQSENHLMSFGEFAAMYLCVWNTVDEKKFKPWSEVENDISYRSGEVWDAISDYTKQSREVKFFNASLFKVRRLLANIPTYMIFDDHEVTDDWNISQQWVKNVKDSECGEKIVCNALMAYWAFQGWGNNPDHFTEGFKEEVEEYLEIKEVANDHLDSVKRLLFDQAWEFSIPANPPILVLDTRTKRQFDGLEKPARLINKERLEWISEEWGRYVEPHEKADTSLIMVSPTPVVGFTPIEFLQKSYKLVGVEKFDVESWSANPLGYDGLVKDMILSRIKPKECIFISGDVHYSFARKKEFKVEGRESGLNVYQLTSSPLKNTSVHENVYFALFRLDELFTRKKRYIIPEGKRKHPVTNENNMGTLLLRESDNSGNKFKLLFSDHSHQQYKLNS